MEKNVGAKDKTIRLIAGLILLGVGISMQGIVGLILAVAGIGLLFTAVTGFCSFYKIAGINTREVRQESPKRGKAFIRR
jgi:uncharacterized membrane protein